MPWTRCRALSKEAESLLSRETTSLRRRPVEALRCSADAF